MPCENPITILIKDPEKGTYEQKVNCGKCILCRQTVCRNWAIKLQKESQYHKRMCMITLTFSPEFLLRPYWVKLIKYKQIQTKRNDPKFPDKIRKKIKYKTCIGPHYIKDVRKTKWLITRFIKKLRKKMLKEYNQNFCYFAVGEHGTKNTHRAHWHIIFFDIDRSMLDCALAGTSGKNKEIYFSKIIYDLWNFKKLSIGSHTVSDVTPATIKYVANYTLKKMYKDEDKDYKTTMQFSNQSKIGIKWVRRYHEQLREGYVTDEEGYKVSVPKSWIKELYRYFDTGFGEEKIGLWPRFETASIIEEKNYEFSKKINFEERIKQNLIKAKRLKYKSELQCRDIF